MKQRLEGQVGSQTKCEKDSGSATDKVYDDEVTTS